MVKFLINDVDFVYTYQINIKTRTRASIRPQAVAEIEAEIQRYGAHEIDPIVVFHDEKAPAGAYRYHLGDGLHRLTAFKRLGWEHIPCIMHEGSELDAIEFGLKANLLHVGERFNAEDKLHSVVAMLQIAPKKHDIYVAMRCRVSTCLVTNVRRWLRKKAAIQRRRDKKRTGKATPDKKAG